MSTKDDILIIAQDLIQRRGVNGMSYQDLADAVGIRKASVHHHFASKSDMVSALLQRFNEQFDQAVAQIANGSASGRTRLKRYLDLFANILEDSKLDKVCVCGVLMAEIASLDEQGIQHVRDFLHNNVQQVCKMIEAGIEDGSLAPNQSVEATADLLLATLEGGLLMARCEGGRKRMKTINDRLLGLLSTG